MGRGINVVNFIIFTQNIKSEDFENCHLISNKLANIAESYY